MSVGERNDIYEYVGVFKICLCFLLVVLFFHFCLLPYLVEANRPFFLHLMKHMSLISQDGIRNMKNVSRIMQILGL